MIDEKAITETAFDLIYDLELWSCGLGDDDKDRVMTLGYVAGITEMANNLKRILRDEQKKIDIPQE